MRIENKILENLICNEDYTRKVVPFLKDEYFEVLYEKKLFKIISLYISKYNTQPTKESLLVLLNDSTDINQTEFDEITTLLNSFSYKISANELDWLVDESESFCQNSAIYNAIMESIKIIDDSDSKSTLSKGSIPGMMSEALSVTFDPNIGHDYIEDSDSRFDFYHLKEEKLPFDIQKFNDITDGGLSSKSLNVILAGTGVGKSLFMCHMAAACLTLGKNVLYITLEMSEERIAERIDANLMNLDMSDLRELPRDLYEKKMDSLKENIIGKLIIKEYPTATASVGHFRHLLNELKLKKKFSPDVIYIDYLNICTSFRLKAGSNINSYIYVKSIAEEIRGLAVEQNVPIVSATQTNRTGFANSDVELIDTAESFGLPATADLMFALITSEDMEELNQILVKQLKNRYNDPTMNRRFIVGVDRAKMKLYDVEETAQVDLVLPDESEEDSRYNRNRFAGFNFNTEQEV